MRSTALVLLFALAACRPEHDNAPDNRMADRQSRVGDANSPAPAAPTGTIDCARARGQAQELVCADHELAAMDGEVGRLSALAASGRGDRGALAAAGRDWAAERDRCWRTDDLRQCILTVYGGRVDALRRGIAAAGMAAPGDRSSGPIAFRCDGLAAPVSATFLATDPGAVYLSGVGEAVALPRVPSGSGERYAGRVGGADWALSVNETEATLTLPEKGDRRCRRAEAR